MSINRGAIVLAALAALLVGCGGGGGTNGKVVASAGDIVVTMAEFQSAYNLITPESRPDISTLEARRSFANDLINKQILLRAGERLIEVQADFVESQIKSTREKGMLDVLHREMVEEKVEVLGRDVKNFYDQRQVNVRAAHILVETAEEAARIREEIISGQILFEDAAAKYSKDQSNRDNGGFLGEIMWSSTVPEFQKVAFSMEPGVISEPVEGTWGVHLILVSDRVEKDLGDFESVRITLRPDVRRDLEVGRMRIYLAELEQKAGLTFHDETFGLLLDAMDGFADLNIDEIPGLERYLPEFTPEQLEMSLASFSGGEWTLTDYMAWLTSRPGAGRPQSRIPLRGMKELVRTMQIQNELLLAEADELGYGDLPEVAVPTRRAGESLVIEMVHARFLQEADVTTEEIKAMFDSTCAANEDAFMVPDRIDMVVMIHEDESVVAQGLARIAAGEPEAAVVRELSMDPKTVATDGKTGLVPRGTFSPELEELVFKPELLGKGWQGPLVTSNGVAGVRLLVYEDARRARFDEVEQEMLRQIANARGEAAFETWLQEQRDSLGVEINDDVLELYGQPIT